MKRTLLFAAAFGLLLSGSAIAVDHNQMHEMMMKKGGPKPDERIELNIPAPMKTMQKGMMRQHMDTISEITSAIAVNDLNKASAVAKEKLGWNPDEEQRCNMVADMTGQPDFIKFGKAVHMKADELADAAKAGNRDKALEHLSQLIKNCNACHEKFRH